MISVVIYINSQPIYVRSARNVTPYGIADDKLHTYNVDDGSVIKHKRDSGAVELAIKMLKTIKSPG